MIDVTHACHDDEPPVPEIHKPQIGKINVEHPILNKN